MEICTHRLIDSGLSGTPVWVADGSSRVELLTTAVMAADAQGLVHGGFLFSAADYAAMIAVNHPHVVLGAADVKFLKPVRVGDTITFNAQVRQVQGRKYRVSVDASQADEAVFEGMFTCFVLDRHVLADS